jgi:mRNA interferase MazF
VGALGLDHGAGEDAESAVTRGAVYWVNLEPASPPEIGKLRPALVVSNGLQNQRLDSLVVVPLSTRAPEIWPLRVKIPVAGLRESYAVVPGIRQASKLRLHELIGHIDRRALDSLSDAVALYLTD